MRRLPTAVFSIALACASCGITTALGQGAPEPARALDGLFEIGLPDVKGGKWVRVFMREADLDDTMSGNGRTEMEGNAWLMREERGVIDAVMDDGRVVRGRMVKDESVISDDAGTSPLPPLTVEPVDLDRDLKTFSAGLNPQTNRRFPGDDDDQARVRSRIAGKALIFLAQLQRQGRGDFVRDALPKAIALAPNPEAALDSAVSLIADGRLTALAREWVLKGDADAYAAEISKLAASFTRGWENRDAALLLAARLHEQKNPPSSSDSGAQRAAELLLNLSPEKFRALPTRRNWLLHGLHGAPKTDDELAFPGVDDGDGAPAAKTAQAPEIEAFFSKKREAAAALAKLIDDRRFLRVTKGEIGERPGFSSTSYGERKSRDARVREQYERLHRPAEVGELAMMLIEPLMPGSSRWDFDENPGARGTAARRWLQSISTMSDEDVAWDYMRNAQNSRDGGFRVGLTFLIENGGAETLAKLREVFADPAVWQGGGADSMIPHTEAYIRRAKPAADFQELLRSAVKKALEEEESDYDRFNQGNKEWKKRLASQHAAQLKQLDRLFKPQQDIAEQLAEIAAMDETEALASLQAMMQSSAKRSVAEVAGPIFRAASKSTSTMVKVRMLSLLDFWTRRGGRETAANGAKSPADIQKDAATRGAMLALLRDDGALPSEWSPDDSTRVADVASWAIISLNEPQEKWQRIGMTVPHLMRRWLKAHALEIADGRPAPPTPDATRIPAERTEALIAELGALAPEKIPAALEARTPDEQLAVAMHLLERPEWPGALAETHFTVRKVSGAKASGLDADKWRGRKLDEKLVHDIQETVEKAALGGKHCAVAVNSGGPLEGVTINAVPNKQALDAEQIASFGLPGLSGKPAPQAMLFSFIQGSNREEADETPAYAAPLWKDAAATSAWRGEHGKPGQSAASKGENQRVSGDPSAFERKLRANAALQKGGRSPFRITISSSAIGDAKARPAPSNE